MRGKMFRIGLMLLAIICFGRGSVFGEQVAASTLTVQGTNGVHLGHVKGVGISNLVFRLKNEGTEPLKITRVYVSCPCLKADYDKKAIQPGEEVALHVAINLAQVRGTFSRNLSVFSDRRGPSEVKLFVTGIVDPVVSGFPDEPVTLMAQDAGSIFTKTFDLTVSDKMYRLGEPLTRVPSGMKIETTLAPMPSGAGQQVYRLTTVATVLAKGQYKAEVIIPVIGSPRQEDMKISFHVHGGLVLFAAPKRVEIQGDAVKAQRFRLTIRGNRPVALDPKKLTWHPKLDGLAVTVSEMKRAAPRSRNASESEAGAKRPSPLTVTVVITPEAAASLLESESPGLVFSYPDFGDIMVKVGGGYTEQDTPPQEEE